MAEAFITRRGGGGNSFSTEYKLIAKENGANLTELKVTFPQPLSAYKSIMINASRNTKITDNGAMYYNGSVAVYNADKSKSFNRGIYNMGNAVGQYLDFLGTMHIAIMLTPTPTLYLQVISTTGLANNMVIRDLDINENTLIFEHNNPSNYTNKDLSFEIWAM